MINDNKIFKLGLRQKDKNMKSQAIDILVILFKIAIQILKIQAKGLTEPSKKKEKPKTSEKRHTTLTRN